MTAYIIDTGIRAEFGFYYMSTADGMSYSDWLRSVRNTFLTSLNQSG